MSLLSISWLLGGMQASSGRGAPVAIAWRRSDRREAMMQDRKDGQVDATSEAGWGV